MGRFKVSDLPQYQALREKLLGAGPGGAARLIRRGGRTYVVLSLHEQRRLVQRYGLPSISRRREAEIEAAVAAISVAIERDEAAKRIAAAWWASAPFRLGRALRQAALAAAQSVCDALAQAAAGLVARWAKEFARAAAEAARRLIAAKRAAVEAAQAALAAGLAKGRHAGRRVIRRVRRIAAASAGAGWVRLRWETVPVYAD